MAKRYSILHLSSVAIILLFAPPLLSQTKQAKPVVVFDVQQNAGTIYISPVVVFANGKFRAPFSPSTVAARRRFVEKYFAPAKSYILIFGGGNAGYLKINKGYWEDGAYAYGELTEFDPGRIRGQLHALATDYDTSARGGTWRRSPTEEERAAAITLAKIAYVEHKISPASLESLEVLNLTAIDVDGDERAELVGSFKVPADKKEKPPHFLFLIAALDGQNYKAVRANYRFNPQQAEYPLGLEMLSDNLDIDGDGVNEIVTIFTGPGYKDSFLVYQRKDGRWNQVFSGGGSH